MSDEEYNEYSEPNYDEEYLENNDYAYDEEQDDNEYAPSNHQDINEYRENNDYTHGYYQNPSDAGDRDDNQQNDNIWEHENANVEDYPGEEHDDRSGDYEYQRDERNNSETNDYSDVSDSYQENDQEEVMENSNQVRTEDIPTGGSEIQGLFSGFGGNSFGDIVGSIGGLSNEGGMLSNLLSSNGGMETMVQNMVASAAHRFLNIDPVTGAIIGSVIGNIMFNLGGQGNSLSSIGKVVLDNIISGKFRRDIKPYTPVFPTHVPRQSFGLNFETERQRCLNERRLFEDPEFPAVFSSIWYKQESYDNSVTWLRPGEITENPQLIVGEKSRFDVKQGELGDCWLLAAAANLTLRDEMFYRVVPPNQSFTENYAGIFHFQFWRYGTWIDIVIDDRLPCRNGKLIYMHSENLNEFWSALLEKAYAKLYGSYEHLDGGTIVEALEDFTGGLTESMALDKTDKTVVLAMIVRGIQMGSLFGCSIHAKENEKEAKLDNGLVCGHAYSITSIKVLKSCRNLVIIRLRNPWGNSKEWNGPWSDGSNDWDTISNDEKHELNLAFQNDGEFWMSFDDFMLNFDEVEVCNLSADVMNEIAEMTGVNLDSSTVKMETWGEKAEEGEWSVQQGTAGGCMNYPESYVLNPQFASYFEITHESLEADGKCTVIIAVLQKFRREMRSCGEDNLPIGLSVYKVDDMYSENSSITKDFFFSHRPEAKTRTYINQREMTLRTQLTPGKYIIVPSTFEPHQDGHFLLRIFANSPVQTTRLR
ncbi:unnamed protein product [Auanema sp. JU1783]|nr:unnamed protein product [Auanema sp. JU1783]